MELAIDRTVGGISIGCIAVLCSGTVRLTALVLNCTEWRNWSTVILSECGI